VFERTRRDNSPADRRVRRLAILTEYAARLGLTPESPGPAFDSLISAARACGLYSMTTAVGDIIPVFRRDLADLRRGPPP
jgi:hypothetical protein